jgi:small-conductance mechanosensitive channel
MWQRFTDYSVWILFIAIIGLIVLLVIRNRVKDGFEKLPPEKRNERRHRFLSSVLLATGVTLIILIVLSAVVIIISREDVFAVITPEKMQEWLLTHGIIILAVIISSYLMFRLFRLVIPRIVAGSVMTRGKARHSKTWLENRTQALSSMLTGISGAIIGVVASFMILSELGVDITPLLAGAGIVSIVFGLGAQGLIKDFVSGVFILLEDRYNKGDVVKVAGISGQVEEVNLRRTVLRDLDGIVHTIPNGEITTASNYTRDWARVKLDVPVSYNEDLDHVFEVINRVGKELAQDEYFGKLVKTPPQVLRVQKFGDSGIDIRVLGETKPMNQWDVAGEFRKRIKEAFDEEGIEIPWPHVKLYLGDQAGSSIICKACSHPNPTGSNFCSNCGAKL